MSLVSNVPALATVTVTNGAHANDRWTRIYALDDSGLIREYCQDTEGGPWFEGALSKAHQGSGSISAVAYQGPGGVPNIEVFTIYANDINRWHWDGKSWTGGRSGNYGQDYVFASREGDTTVLLTRNPARPVTYTISGGRWRPVDGPALG